MSLYWQGNGSGFPKRKLSEYLRTVWSQEQEGRKNVYSNELPYLLRGIPPSFLVGGEFSSVLTNQDATGQPNYFRALQEYLTGFDLVLMWDTSQERFTYTRYTSLGASSIDRIYVSRNLS